MGLKQFLGSRLNKLYCYYLRYVIAVFEKVNTVLQCEEPKVHKLHAILVAFFKELLIQLVTPSSIRKASSPLQVDFTLAANKRENEDLMIGQEARDFLSSSKLKPEKVGEFYASVKLFLQTSLIYLKHKLPFDNEILQKAQIADPEFQDAARFTDIRFFTEKYPILAKHCSLDQLEKEFSLYQVTDVAHLREERVDHWWVKIGQLKDDLNNQPQFNNLAKFMLGILTLPHSSAHCERIFSMVRKNKTDFRASMQHKTLQSLIVLKSRPQSEGYSEDQLRAIKRSCSQALSLSQ